MKRNLETRLPFSSCSDFETNVLKSSKASIDVFLLTRANSDIGFGHLNRTIVLAEAFQEQGRKVGVHVVGDQSSKWLLPLWEDVNVESTLPHSYPSARCCIVDGYWYEENFYRELREHFDHLVIFDDEGRKIPSMVAGVINPNLHGCAENYPFGIKVFTGAGYCLVRKDLQKAKCTERTNDVFICTGGSDPAGQMDRLLELYRKTNNRPIQAVFGPGFEYPEIITKWRNVARVTVHHHPSDFANVMASCSYALCSAGSMLYELAAVEVPAISIALAENQEKVGKAYQEKGWGLYLGHFETLDNETLNKGIYEMEMRHAEYQETLHAACLEGGAERLSRDLFEWLEILERPESSPYTVESIRSEYDESSRLKSEHEKLRWGTAESMNNRMKLALNKIDFARHQNWLDIGSGTGLYQEHVLERFPQINAVGLELSLGLFQLACDRQVPGAKFHHGDFLSFSSDEKFDLITCFGVMAKTNIGFSRFLDRTADLLIPGGLVVADFKNRSWQAFEEPSFFADPRHLWFSPVEIVRAVKEHSQFCLQEVFGYLPRENRIVDLLESHTFYLILRRLESSS